MFTPAKKHVHFITTKSTSKGAVMRCSFEGGWRGVPKMYIIKTYTLLKQMTSVKDIKKLVEFADMITNNFFQIFCRIFLEKKFQNSRKVTEC